MSSIISELDRIVQSIRQNYKPEKIILFGSIAEDKLREGSDVDIMVVKDTVAVSRAF